jgi:hypothetical protein
MGRLLERSANEPAHGFERQEIQHDGADDFQHAKLSTEPRCDPGPGSPGECAEYEREG